VVLVASGPTVKARKGFKFDQRTAVGLVLGAIGILAIGLLVNQITGQESTVSNDELGRATVRLVAGDVVGSGTIIDADEGLILTNAHVVARDAPGSGVRDLAFDFELDSSPREIEVLVAPALGKAAEPRYVAEVEAVDGYLDLAVLRITKTIGGQLIEPDSGDLDGLVAMDIGDSSGVQVGDPIRVFGYPTAAQTSSVTLTEGSVSGLVQDDRLKSNRAMLNISAGISPGNSGGLAVDEAGDLIGIPSLIRDDTVPSMRPSEFAKALVDAARSGEDYVSPWFRSLTSEEITGVRLVNPGSQSGITFDCDGGRPESIERGRVGIAFDFEGFGAGEHQDMFVLVQSADSTVGLRTLNLDYPVEWPANGCATITVPIDSDTAIDIGAISVLVGVGPNYDTDR
jgi:S1-C subfamily serine protease